MAYKWSWAFGAETELELNNLAQWTMGTTTPADVYPESTIVHTYIGDAADRYSLATEDNIHDGPPSVGNVRGWAACYFYFNNASGFTSLNDIFSLVGPNSGVARRIAVTAKAGNGFNLTVGGSVFIGSVTGLQNFAWNHIALKYDMFAGGVPTAAEWSAELYVNGVLSASGSREVSFLEEETECYFEIQGPSTANLPNNTFFSDIVFYDSQADPNPYGQFVTRINPYTDTADSGSWTPASDGGSPGAQSSNLSGSISTTPVVGEADPLTGEHVTVQTQEVATTVGLSSFTSYGFTGHLYASGSSATNLIAGLEVDAPNSFVTGAAQIDGENMYAWSSDTTTLSSGSIIFLKAEVSGS
jgi:hypothetical protein